VGSPQFFLANLFVAYSHLLYYFVFATKPAVTSE